MRISDWSSDVCSSDLSQLKRLANFIVAAVRQSFREGLEETSKGFVLADLIARSWKKIGKIKLLLVTNRVNKARTDAQPIGEIGGIPVTSNVWDMSSIERTSGVREKGRAIQVELGG